MALRALIICPSEELSTRLEATLAAIPGVQIGRLLNKYPSATELSRVLRVHSPEVVFLSFEVAESARVVVEHIEKDTPGVPIVGIHHNFDAAVIRETMRCGVREFVASPFEVNAVLESLAHVQKLLERNPVHHESTNQVYAFLPSKAGVGASTLALNVSAALAKLPNSRVLLADFDLNSGVLRFSLNLPNDHSVIEAVEHVDHLDEKMWSHLVATRGNLDLLHAGSINPSVRIEPEKMRKLITFAQRGYSALCFDLSGNLERYSVEIMQESKRVIVVCTAELPSLHLAREKCEFLKNHDLGSQIDIVLNRVTDKPLLTTAQVEKVLGMPVKATFSNDYPAVRQSIATSSLIDSASQLGKQISEFAYILANGHVAPQPSGSKKGLLSFLSVPARLAVLK